MPWKIYSDKDEDGNSVHCIHKLKEDGSKGKKVKCHQEKSDAEDQLAALYASEEEGSSHHDDDMKKSVDEENRDHPDDQKNISSNLSEQVENSDDPETSKMSSFNEMIREVADAWYEQNDYMGYVHEVYPDHAIIHMRKNYWKVPYSKQDSSISFADSAQWEKVEEKREWVNKKDYAIKSLGGNRIGAYGVIWGDKDKKDLHGEWFDEDTEELKTIFSAMGKVPFMFHHGADDVVKSTVIAEVDVMEEDEKGLWFEAKIKEFEAYQEYVKPFIDKKMLFPSSGTLPGAKRVTKEGRIKRWPIAEITGTHIPAEFRMMERPIDEIKSAYKSVGIDADFEEFANEDEVQEEDNTKGVEEMRLRIQTELSQRKAKLLELELI